jgi:hypothetical protein
VKEKLELHLTEANKLVRENERIIKGINSMKNEDENLIKKLSYVSKINKKTKDIMIFFSEFMRNLEISFQEEQNKIIYEEYYFNGFQIPENIKFENINYDSFTILWQVKDMNIKNIEKIKFKNRIEIRQENGTEKFTRIYEGDKILIVDTVPKENATNVLMINNGGIGFSNTGINGPFNSAWTIDNVFNAEQINVINFTANLIKGGTLKLGSNLNQNGNLEVYDTANNLIAELNNNGLKMYGADGSYILMNNTVGFVGYDRLGNQIYWVNGDEFHQKKSVIEEEITLCNKLRFIPITITDSNNNIVNDGIGLVSVYNGGGS